MARILLVSLFDINAGGLRSLSSCLKAEGHSVGIVFLHRNAFPYNIEKKYRNASRDISPDDWVGIDSRGIPFRYSRGPATTDEEQQLFLSVVRDYRPQVIGCSVTTPLLKDIGEIIRHVKMRVDVPVVFGGPAATADPEACLKHCDVVCIGEAELAVLDMAQKIDKGEDVRAANNMAYVSDGQIIRNPLAPLTMCLDDLPFPDIAPEGKWLVEGNAIHPNFSEVSYSRNEGYHVMSSRGCPYRCSYCNESMYQDLYAPQRYLRRRSPGHVIAELVAAKQRIGCRRVVFEDEIFSGDTNWLEEFCERYRAEIDLPFHCNVYPHRHVEQNLVLLNKMGIAAATLSLQSGSERLNREIFCRPFQPERFLQSVEVLRALNIPWGTDIITANPFETEDDLEETFRLVLRIPTAYHLCINKLYVTPGTKIHRLVAEAKHAGVLSPLPHEAVEYYDSLFWLANRRGAAWARWMHDKRIGQRFPSMLRLLLRGPSFS